MALTLTTASKNALIDTLTARLSIGTTNPTGALQFYTAGGPESGVQLGTATFANPAFPAASGASATANAITRDESADATGTAAVVVFMDRNRAEVGRGTVTANGGGGDMTMPSTSVTAGEPFEISGVVITM